jgi:voltage-gated potassium channel
VGRWAIVTVTTGGYGDFYSKDVEVRLIAIVVMLFGIGFLSVLTATVASQFIQTDTANLSGILDADRDAVGAPHSPA